MAQASVELPETTEAAPATADDLLSQLAGEEIDRLLAEADGKPAGRAESEPAKPIAPPVTTPAGETAPAAEPEPEATPQAAAAVPADTAAAMPANEPSKPVAEADHHHADPSLEGSVDAIAADDKSVMSAELDQLFNELSAPDKPGTAESQSSSQSAEVPAETPTSSAERDGLAEAPSDTAVADADAGEPASVPVYLKPLVWLNAPLQLIPEPARELTGKVAIVTFMNSLALLVYLLVFRRG